MKNLLLMALVVLGLAFTACSQDYGYPYEFYNKELAPDFSESEPSLAYVDAISITEAATVSIHNFHYLPSVSCQATDPVYQIYSISETGYRSAIPDAVWIPTYIPPNSSTYPINSFPLGASFISYQLE